MSSQLHNFSDALGEGYGAVLYLRVVKEARDVHFAFFMGKLRQTPQKSVTIPHLELSAAVVASRWNRMMQHELDVAVDEEFFWTDSTYVLSYIVNKGKMFQTLQTKFQQSMKDHDQTSGTMLTQVLTLLTIHLGDFPLESKSTKTTGPMALPFCGKWRTAGLSNLTFLWK